MRPLRDLVVSRQHRPPLSRVLLDPFDYDLHLIAERDFIGWMPQRAVDLLGFPLEAVKAQGNEPFSLYVRTAGGRAKEISYVDDDVSAVGVH